MRDTPRTDSKTLAEAMGQIAILLQTDDGVANAAIAEAANRITELERELAEAKKDVERLDWLADPDNRIGNVQLPKQCVEQNLDSLRHAIDAAMPLDQWDRDNINDEINRKENQNE